MTAAYAGSEDIQSVDFSVNLLEAVLWQYNNSPNLIGILQAKQDWYETNNEAFWDDFVTNIFDLRTANEFGLAVWSIILGLPSFVNTPAPDKPTFGFDIPSYGNFDNSNFTDQFGGSVSLPLETARIALQLRYFQLVSSGTVPETNRMLASVFANYGKAFLRDYGDMTQGYVFLFPVTWDLRYLFNSFDILPRPAGVASTWIDATLPYFGFGPFGLNFDNGNFGD